MNLFDQLWKRIRRINPGRISDIDPLNLRGKPFARSLLLGANQILEDANQFAGIAGWRAPSPQDKLNERVATAAVIVSYLMALEAAKAIQKKAIFLPPQLSEDPLPDYAHAIVGFAIYILFEIEYKLREEGFALDLKDLWARTASTFFSMWSNHERATHCVAGYECFKKALNSTDVQKMHEEFMDLVNNYVGQWDKAQPKHAQLNRLLGRGLQVWLNCSGKII